jgi:four helix bundle protein
MATIKRFEDLECWQEARRFVKFIYELTKKERFRKDLELVGQVKDSVISAMSNIAEGFHRRSTKEFMRFLDISRASIAETVSHCYVALDQEYIDSSDMDKVNEKADIVWKKVNNFISYLNSLPKTRKGIKKSNQTNETNGTN